MEDRTQELYERNQQLSHLNEMLKEMSVTDSLTGLKNRRYLYEFIEPRVAAVNRRVEDTQKDRVVSGKIDITPSIFFVMIDLARIAHRPPGSGVFGRRDVAKIDR